MSDDKKFLLVSTLSSKTFLMDNSLGEQLATYTSHHTSTAYHSSCRFSACQSYLAQASEDHNIVLYDIVSKECLGKLRGHIRPVVSVERHPSVKGKWVSGSADGCIKIWSA